MRFYRFVLFCTIVLAPVSLSQRSTAQEYGGPLLPHVGAKVTTAFANRFGPDAEAFETFTAVTPESLNLAYASTRGLNTNRNILNADRNSASVYVLGYAANMPLVIPGTTSLGLSSLSLIELRGSGTTPLSLIYDTEMSRIDGQLVLTEKDIRIPVLIADRMVEVPVLRAQGTFSSGDKSGTADFYILDNKNNPMMVQSKIQFSWEPEVRLERIVHVEPSASQRSAMEQALSTVRRYQLHGIHFDFDKATVRPESRPLIKELAVTLQNNPTWTIEIDGNTDSIGDPAYNQRLSAERAASVAAVLVEHGIDVSRLRTAGLGDTQPIGDNGTLQGRALNRRVELVRTDR